MSNKTFLLAVILSAFFDGLHNVYYFNVMILLELLCCCLHSFNSLYGGLITDLFQMDFIIFLFIFSCLEQLSREVDYKSHK